MFKCPNCTKKYTSKKSLDYHLNKAKYSCSLKSRAPTSNSMHQEDGLKCQLCGNKFSTKSSLKRHLKNIHSVTSGKKSEEKTGSKKLVINEDESNIEVDDEVEGVFRCPLCSNTFTRQSSLNRHLSEARCKAIKTNQPITNTPSNLTNINNSGTFYNGTVIDNSNNINNNNNHTLMVNFGKEQLDKLAINYDKCFKHDHPVTEFTRQLNFEPENPERHNIFIANRYTSFVDLLRSGEWEIDDKDDVVQDMFQERAGHLCEKYDELYPDYKNVEQAKKEGRKPVINYKFLGFKDNVNNAGDEWLEKEQRHLKMLLTNKRKMAIKQKNKYEKEMKLLE